MKILRTLASVLGSYIAVFVIVSLSDPILTHFYPAQYVRGQVPPNFLLWISTAVFMLASVLGGWLCVRLAPSKPGAHLLALFVLGELVGLSFTLQAWRQGWPHWYSLVWLIAWPVCLWFGGLGRRSAPAPRLAT